MTRQEAISLMMSGKKLTHTYFQSNEWVTINEKGNYLFEDGVELSSNEFLAFRTADEWNYGWELFNEPSNDLLNDMVQEPEQKRKRFRISKIALFFGFMYICTIWKSIDIIVYIVLFIKSLL